VNGYGHEVGEVLTRHEHVEMISFTGSTEAGIRVARSGAEAVKRVHQELGGKSANIVLPDVDLQQAISGAVRGCFANSGQSCVSPSRLLVPEMIYDSVLAIARDTAEAMLVGDPLNCDTQLGPVVSAKQFERVQCLIRAGIDEGATLVSGGLGRPEGIECGYFVRPTVFGNVTSDMTIARQEIFGPVLSIIRYRDEDEAICIANDSSFGLAAHIQCRDLDLAESVAARLRAGYIYVNYSSPDYSAPFGGYKQSGNGREYGEWGLEAFLELKSIVGVSG
jgi:aldehyde dehydrogenase (NAD+)